MAQLPIHQGWEEAPVSALRGSPGDPTWSGRRPGSGHHGSKFFPPFGLCDSRPGEALGWKRSFSSQLAPPLTWRSQVPERGRHWCWPHSQLTVRAVTRTESGLPGQGPGPERLTWSCGRNSQLSGTLGETGGACGWAHGAWQLWVGPLALQVPRVLGLVGDPCHLRLLAAQAHLLPPAAQKGAPGGHSQPRGQGPIPGSGPWEALLGAVTWACHPQSPAFRVSPGCEGRGTGSAVEVTGHQRTE